VPRRTSNRGSVTKERILDTTAALFRQQGFSATSMAEIAAETDSTISPLYLHFPGGKDDLGEAVIRYAADRYQTEVIEAALDSSSSLARAVGNLFTGVIEHLVDSDYAEGCPISTVALEVAATNDSLRETTAEAYEGWIGAMAERLQEAGVTRAGARKVATAVVALLEGALILARAARSTEALEVTRVQAMEVVGEAVNGSSHRTRAHP
jgi:AcrR family transcriptional regulator